MRLSPLDKGPPDTSLMSGIELRGETADIVQNEKAPRGQRTTLTVDANGYLATVTNPANERVQLSYSAEGLLLTQTDPNGGLYRYSYDALGRLIKDEDPAGGAKTLARVDNPTGHTVTLTTALGRTSTYQAELLPTGALRHINSDLNGAITEVVRNPDGTRSVTYPDGAHITSTLGPDPRFGIAQRQRRKFDDVTCLAYQSPNHLLGTPTFVGRIATSPRFCRINPAFPFLAHLSPGGAWFRHIAKNLAIQ